jgi:hypothetical protein
MSKKNDKKLRREVRAQVRYNYGEGLEALSRFVRPRPWWIPKRIWVLLYLPVFPARFVRIIEDTID